MAGALPSAYQFARDPQSGQLIVIPSEHLPHFGEYLNKGVGVAHSILWGRGGDIFRV